METMTRSLDARINAMMSVLIRPNRTFSEIAGNHKGYFVAAIALLAISSFFFVNYTTEELDPVLSINEMGYVLDARYQAESFGKSVFWNILSIVLIFYIGMRIGGSNSFRKVFSVMAFAMIPVLVGGITLHIFFTYPPLLEGITGIGKESPEFAGLFWPLYFAFMIFALWSFVLTIKAIKIVDKISTAKAFGILLASVVAIYFVNLAITFAL